MDPEQLQLTNPARRLHAFLVRAKTLKGNSLTHEMLAEWFEVPKGNMAEIFEKFSSFLRLIEDTKRHLSNIDDPNKDNFMKCIPPIQGTFDKINLDNQWQHYASKPTESDLALLALAGQALDKYHREALISGATLNEIRDETTALFDTVNQSDIHSELKVIILDLLETIRRSISDYKIRGAEGLKKSVAESIGRLALEKNLVLQEKDKEAFRKFWDFLSKLNLIVSSAMYAKLLGEGLEKVMGKLLE